MMNPYPLAIWLTLFSQSALAKPDLAKLVPGSKVTKQELGDFELSTPSGTKVEVTIGEDGEIEEASGEAAVKGDVFEPGGKLITLKAAVEVLLKAKKAIQGEWTFEEIDDHGWVYDIEGMENRKSVDFIVSAENGKLIRTEVDE